jgi:hypothetical protein
MVIAPGNEGPVDVQERVEKLRPTMLRAAAEAYELAVPRERALELFESVLGTAGRGQLINKLP